LVANFRYRLTTALALAGIGLVAVTLFQVRFGLLPLRQIEHGLAAIRSGGASKLEGELPAEIEPLQSELNALIKSNQDIVDRARTHVGNLAHALKTPLAVITNEARGDKTGLGAKVAEQAKVMGESIQHYLDRARMAARVNVIGRVTPVAPVIDPLVRTLERIHAAKGVRISVSCPPDARFQGERQDLEEMLGNLLDNACKWARKAVSLEVEPSPSTARAHNRRLLIVISDDGPGLTREQRSRIGKRGLRLDETKPGSGLGLSIVMDLAQSYRGSCELAASPAGGLTARLDLPAA
jgi:signal transduction histidine kinase